MNFSQRVRRSAAGSVAVATALAISLVPQAALAATGDLDTGFSGDGLLATASSTRNATASTMTSDGKLLVAGVGGLSDGSSAMTGVYIGRHTSLGALDTAFGSSGLAKFDVSPGAEIVRDVATDSTGRVLVTGIAVAPAAKYPDTSDIFVARLTAAGVLDTTFGSKGIALVSLGNHDRVGGLVLSGSRILLGATQDTGGNFGNEWSAIALTSAGALDTTFSSDGKAEVPTSLLSTYDGLRDIAVQSDGKILLGGFNGTSYAVARMTTSGGLDTSFGGDGKAYVDFGGKLAERALTATMAGDSKIVLGGYVTTSIGMDFGVARLNNDGTLDTSFSGDGLVTTSTLATSNEMVEALSIGASDRIYAVGENQNGWSLAAYSGGANRKLSAAAVSVTEGNSGSTNAVFTVKLSASTTSTVTVVYGTVDGTAKAGSDYTKVSGKLSFAPGETSKTISVPVIGDTLVEANETFTVSLSYPANAGLSNSSATGTIVNND